MEPNPGAKVSIGPERLGVKNLSLVAEGKQETDDYPCADSAREDLEEIPPRSGKYSGIFKRVWEGSMV